MQGAQSCSNCSSSMLDDMSCKDKGLTAKLNAAVGNITSNTAASARQHELSHSGDPSMSLSHMYSDYNSADWSSNGSDGSNSARGSSNQRNVGSEDRPSSAIIVQASFHEICFLTADDRKSDTDSNPVNDGERSTSLKVSSGVSGTAGLAQAFSVKKNGTPVPQTTMIPGCDGVPSEPYRCRSEMYDLIQCQSMPVFLMQYDFERQLRFFAFSAFMEELTKSSRAHSSGMSDLSILLWSSSDSNA
ncbi:hypothetical protein ZIOFF_002637 [Zingiber officinale]|uniref:Uncharacterized protein n=1 Tax=Zingiber officinale TaxID=94328 RepID=A0A8J5LW35_ZINOF|nr:hypothetical protein ZIOFF_002637 [Zingiber officinale]